MDTIDVQSADGKITALDSGGYSFFGDAYFWNDVPMNLISFGKCRSYGIDIRYDYNQDVFTMKHLWFGDIVFERNSDNIYVSHINMRGNAKRNDAKTVYQGDVTKLNSYVNKIRDSDVKCKANYKFSNAMLVKLYDRVDILNDIDKFIAERSRLVNNSINLLPCNLTNPVLYKAHMLNVRDQMMKYTKHEVKRAERSRELQWKLGVSTPQQLNKQLRYNKIEDPNCYPQDIVVAEDIWGRDLANLKGKSTAKKNLPIVNDSKVVVTRQLQTAYGDVMFFQGKTYLVIILQPIDLILVDEMKNRSEEVLLKSTLKMLRRPLQSGLTLKSIYFDREGGIMSEYFQQKLFEHTGIQGIQYDDIPEEFRNQMHERLNISVTSTGATAGIDIIERPIRTIKERCRGIFNVLPYSLPKVMEPGLVNYCVLRINSEIKSTGTDERSPRERLNGRINSKSWIRHGFGDYVQVHSEDSNRAGYNNMEGRTIGALALYPIDNVSGTWCYMALKTWSLIYRNRGTSMPITDNVIEYINDKADGNVLPDYEDENENSVSHDTPFLPIAEIMPVVVDEVVEEQTENDGSRDVDEPVVDNGINNSEVLGSINITDNGNEVRRSARIRDMNIVSAVYARRQRMKYLKNYKGMRNALLIKKVSGNMTVEEGISKLGYEATKSIVSEMMQLVDKNVFQGRHVNELSLSELKKVITCRMFLKEKTNADGVFEKVKARLVVQLQVLQ